MSNALLCKGFEVYDLVPTHACSTQPHELDKHNDIKVLPEKLLNFYWLNLNCCKTIIQPLL